MEVESKFNLNDWNGYLHTYETIEEYNAAKKLLPHVARIESTKEAKYIPRTQAGLPELRMGVDNMKSIIGQSRYYRSIEEYIDDFNGGEFGYGKIYKLLGEIKMSRGSKRYLWELCQIDSQDALSFNNEMRRYVTTDTIEQGTHIVNSDHTKMKKCWIISVNDDSNMERYDPTSDSIIENDNDRCINVIYEIYAAN